MLKTEIRKFWLILSIRIYLKYDMTPKELGFYFPAEWYNHRATWLTFPRNIATWEDRFERIYPAYFAFIRAISQSERVCINGHDEALCNWIKSQLPEYKIDPNQVDIFPFPTNDSWCRDHGPALLLHQDTQDRMVVNWGYNAWGGKYPPFSDDDRLPLHIADYLSLPTTTPGIIMEGGSVEFNGAGSILTSKVCLLNPNRNPHLTQADIERYLCDYYGAEQVLWVSEGIVGDDTDGHIDDTTRFINHDTVLTATESNRLDANYEPLKQNLSDLKSLRLPNGQALNIVELPMPDPVVDSGERLPASYANFYITNGAVIVPTYRCRQDDVALQIIERCFPTRDIIGIDSTEIIWGLGSFHCLSQQEPIKQ